VGTAYEQGGPKRFRHQTRGLQKLIKTGGVTALLFDPGLGKTATVIDYAGLLALKSPTREARILVVCPLVAVDTWVLQSEIFMSPQVNYWAEALGGSLMQRAEALASRGGNPYRRRGQMPPSRLAAPRALHHRLSIALGIRCADPPNGRQPTASQGPDGLGDERPRVILEVVNLDTFASRQLRGKSSTMADVLVDAVGRFNPDLLVVDESHKIKATKSNVSRVFARLSKTVRRRVILTGTVMPHSPMDVFGQWRFLDPYAFGEPQPDGSVKQMTWEDFQTTYRRMGGFMGKEVKGYQNLDRMQSIMARNAVVARKADALDLPPTTDVVIPVALSPEETRAYAEMKTMLSTSLADGTLTVADNRLVQMLRLRQVTSGHLPGDGSGPVHVIGTSKVDTIKSLVEDTLAGEKRIVIFCLFSAEIAMLAKALTAKGTEVMVIQGGTLAKERLAMRLRFGSASPARIVMIAQIKTMSLAVNELVTASHAIFGSLSQQRDDLEQAKARLDRQGQTKPVTFWYALAPGTVDEVIYKSHQDRTDLENAMLRHVAQDARREERGA
jgi:SNF2 family DNA or RNA helicase